MECTKGVSKYACDICSAEFTEKRSLMRHQRIFHREQRILYVCNTCGRGFSRLDSLKRHEKTQHTPEKEARHGEKRFVCSECKAQFLEEKHLSDHRKTHYPKDTYLCHACGRVFNQHDNFTKHLRQHSREVPSTLSSSARKRKHTAEQPSQLKSKF